MGKIFLSESGEERRPFLGRSEIQVGLLWLAQCLIEGNTAVLRLLREAGSVVSVAAMLCVLAACVGTVGILLLWLRRVSLGLGTGSVSPVVSGCGLSPLTSGHPNQRVPRPDRSGNRHAGLVGVDGVEVS